MANIKELKKRIKSTKQTFKITTAMKLVSAAKMSKAQEAILGSRPYAKELEGTIKAISALIQDYSHPYLIEQKDNNKILLLVISSDKGLCGGYNSQLGKKVKEFLRVKNQDDIKIYNIGKKVREILGKKANLGTHYKFKKAEPNYDEVEGVAKELASLFKTGEVGSVYVAYNQFVSAIQFIPTIKQLLPISFSIEEKDKLRKEFPFDFKYDLPAKEILDSLIPEAYLSTLYTCQLDALAAEHGSRMSAMDSASKNCKEVIRSLTLTMNKLRQAAITTELIEVVSGAEALNG